MVTQLILIIHLLAQTATAQPQPGIVPGVSDTPFEDGVVRVLHLAPGYTTSVRVPEEVSSVAIGDPARFKAEHSEVEPGLVFFKPITSEPCATNALITTKSGHEVTLHLVSTGRPAANTAVDFLAEYRLPHAMLIDSDRQSFLIAETRQLSSTVNAALSAQPGQDDVLGRQLARQRKVAPPVLQGKENPAFLGDYVEDDHQAILGFSVLNNSRKVIELLPPQLELVSHRGGRTVKAEPVPVSDFRLSARRLQPGQRADGVIVFDRPAFKESTEQLQLRLAEADQVDRPILLPIPFTPIEAGAQ